MTALSLAEFVLFVSDASQPLTASELEFLPEAGSGVIVVRTLDSRGRVSRHLVFIEK